MTEMIINRQVLWPRSWYLKMDYSVWNLILCSLQLCATTLPYINIYLFNICGGFSPGAMVPNLTVGYPMNRHKSNNFWQKIFSQNFYHKYAVIIMMIHYSWYNDDNEVSVCTSNPCQQKTASNALVQFFFHSLGSLWCHWEQISSYGHRTDISDSQPLPPAVITFYLQGAANQKKLDKRRGIETACFRQ